jgi:hypothetical protein
MSLFYVHRGKSIWQLHLQCSDQNQHINPLKPLAHKVMLRPTVSRAVYLGVKPPIWGLRPHFYYCQIVVGLLVFGALSHERTGLSFTITADFASAVILGSESCGIHDHILLSQIRDSSNLEGQVPHIYVPQWQGGPVIFLDTEFHFHRLLRFAELR